MTTEEWAIVIAAISLVLSVGSLIWQVFTARGDRAKLIVTVNRVVITWQGGPLQHVFHVRVINAGKRPTTLNSLWLMLGRPASRWLPKRMTKRRRVAMLMPGGPGSENDTVIPLQLDVGHEASRFYPSDIVELRLREIGEGWVYGQAGASTTSARGGLMKILV